MDYVEVGAWTLYSLEYSAWPIMIENLWYRTEMGLMLLTNIYFVLVLSEEYRNNDCENSNIDEGDNGNDN